MLLWCHQVSRIPAASSRCVFSSYNYSRSDVPSRFLLGFRFQTVVCSTYDSVSSSVFIAFIVIPVELL
jgi:hypothetical protein